MPPYNLDDCIIIEYHTFMGCQSLIFNRATPYFSGYILSRQFPGLSYVCFHIFQCTHRVIFSVHTSMAYRLGLCHAGCAHTIIDICRIK